MLNLTGMPLLRMPLDRALSEEWTRKRLKLAKKLWNWEPHEGGQREFLLAPHKRKVLACGRKWGKSMGLGADVCTFALCFGGQQLLFAPTQEQTDFIFEQVVSMLQGSRFGGQVKVTRSPHRNLMLLRGNRKWASVKARSTHNEGRNARGDQAHRAICDESAFIDKRALQEVIQPMLAVTGGQLVLLSTPFGRNYFWEAFQRGQPENDAYDPDYYSMQRASETNPYLNKAHLEQARRELAPEQFEREYLARFQESEGKAFPAQAFSLPGQPGSCLLEEAFPPCPEAFHRYAIGVDVARYSDFTVIWVADVTCHPFKCVWLERFNQHTPDFLAMQHRIGYWEYVAQRVGLAAHTWNAHSIKVDATGSSDSIVEMIRAVLGAQSSSAATLTQGVVFTAQSKREMVHDLAAKLHQGLVAFPIHGPGMQIAISEHRHFERILSADSGSEKFSAPAGEHDDCVAAHLLAIRNETPLFKVLPPPTGAVGGLVRHFYAQRVVQSRSKEGGENLCQTL